MIRRTWCLAIFALRSNLRLWITRVGAVAGAGVLLLGPVLSLLMGRGWTLDDALAFYGLVVALLFCLRSGLALEREGDLDLFLVHNLVGQVEHAAAMTVSLLLTWILVLGATLVILVIVSGDPGLAAWHTAAWGLRSAVPLGFVLLVERHSTVRLPFIVPAFGYLLAVVAATVLVGEEEALGLFVITDRADPATLIPLLRQALTVTVLAVGAFLAAAWIGERRAGPGRRAGRRRFT